jgi:hypothetical protein
MRDPIGRLVSQYMHEWRMHEVKGSLEQAVAEHERFVAYSCYHRQLSPYLKSFDPAQLLLVFFEHMIKHPERELERVARFLGDDSDEPVVWHEAIARQNASADRMRRSKSREAFTQSPAGQFLKHALSQEVKDSLKTFWKMKKKPKPSPELRSRLEPVFNEDLGRLGKLLGLKLSLKNYTDVAESTEPRLRHLR